MIVPSSRISAATKIFELEHVVFGSSGGLKACKLFGDFLSGVDIDRKVFDDIDDNFDGKGMRNKRNIHLKKSKHFIF